MTEAENFRDPQADAMAVSTMYARRLPYKARCLEGIEKFLQVRRLSGCVNPLLALPTNMTRSQDSGRPTIAKLQPGEDR